MAIAPACGDIPPEEATEEQRYPVKQSSLPGYRSTSGFRQAPSKSKNRKDMGHTSMTRPGLNPSHGSVG